MKPNLRKPIEMIVLENGEKKIFKIAPFQIMKRIYEIIGEFSSVVVSKGSNWVWRNQYFDSSQKIHAFERESSGQDDKNQPQTFVYISEQNVKEFRVESKVSNQNLVFFMKEELRPGYGYVPVSISAKEISNIIKME